MQKKIFFRFGLALVMLGSASCSGQTNWWNGDTQEAKETIVATSPAPVEETVFVGMDPNDEATVFNKRVPSLNSLLVCRDKQCAPAELSMSREFIYNSLAQLIDNNLDATALLCEANPQAHVCVNPYLTVPAKVGVTPAYVFFDGVKIVDATFDKGRNAFNLALGYNLSYNGQTPTVCKPDTAKLYVKTNNDIVLNGNGFKCNMTSVGATTVRVMFAVDYIDLDYGYIGGYYTIGLSGPANGGGSGYGLIRMPKDAHPLKPVLSLKNKKEYTPLSAKKAPVKPQVKAVNKPVLPVEPTVSAVANKAPNGQYPEVSEEQPVVYMPHNDANTRNVQVNNYPKVEPDVAPAQFEEVYVNDLDDYIK